MTTGRRSGAALAAIGVALFWAGMALRAAEPAAAGYDGLVRLFEEWRAFQQPRFLDGIPDYTAPAMEAQRQRLPEYRTRLQAIDTVGWPVAQRIDRHLVWAEMNGLDFDHRVLRPWARNPGFYSVVVESQSDTPLKEGPVMAGTIELWRLELPLPAAEAAALHDRLAAIPAILEQARGNLVVEARDLWRAGVMVQEAQSEALAAFAAQVAPHHPELVPEIERGRQAVDGFRAWVEERAATMTAPSGIGIENYDWYLRNVHLVPYGWAQELQAMERELARATAHLKLEEKRNERLPELAPVADAAEWETRANAAVNSYIRFLRGRDVLAVTDFMEPALRERLGSFVPAEERHFFAQVDARDPRVLRCHGSHWWDLARMELAPHPSPIRRLPSLYNIWDSRAEGLATAMEELMMSAGLYADSPRSRELVYIMLAQRAARALASLRLHANQVDLDGARALASAGTPRGWLQEDGPLNRFEQALYMEQPGYGTSYVTGKLLLEDLMAERSRQQADAFTVPGFFEELFASGMIPVSLIRWELTGQADQVPGLEMDDWTDAERTPASPLRAPESVRGRRARSLSLPSSP